MPETQVALLRPHSAMAIIPLMRAEEYAEFLADVRERGIAVPLDVDATDGRTVLDGRHRLRAAKDAGLKTVPTRAVKLAAEDTEAYVYKAAVLRRHLTDDQRATLAARWAKAHPKPTGAAAHRKRQEVPTQGPLAKRDAHEPARREAAEMFRVTPKAVERAASVEKARPDLAEKVHAGEMRLKEAERQVRVETQARRVATAEIPSGEFSVIVADPPWPYEKRREDVTHRGACPYPPMAIDAICALRVPSAADCILWLWTTNAFMRDAFRVLDSWGFVEKTILTWAKSRIGLGDWLRGQTEHCIVAIKGRPVVTLTNQTTLLAAPAREHSRKPEEVYRLVESLCPAPARLDMFSREERDGWTSHGAEGDAFPRSS